MTTVVLVWMLVMTGGESKGRMIGPFQSEAACEKVRLVFNHRAGVVRDAGVCAEVMK